MSNAIYLFNILGCLEKYRDLNTAASWLRRASQEIAVDEFNALGSSIHNWLLKNKNSHDIAEPIYQMLNDFFPSSESEWHANFKKELHKVVEEQFRVQAYESARREREQVELLKQIELSLERQNNEALLRQTEAKRNAFLQELNRQLEFSFLDVDSFFREFCSNLVSPVDFEQEKISFVKAWVATHSPIGTSGETRRPDDEQARAIAAVHGHVQIVARAGSGKTTTLVNRTLFLLKHCGIAPHEMLLLAFNRKAALEIRRRLLALLCDGAEAAISADIDRRVREISKHKKIDWDEIESNAVDSVATKLKITLPHVMTFHALAYAVVHPEESLLYNGAEGEAQGLSRVFQQVIDDHLQSPAFKEQIRELMLAHFREDWDRIVEGCYDQSKEELLRFRRSLPRESLGGEYVKSFGEKVIADFLFEHDITYKYERNHWWSGINYRPDFTIFQTPKSGTIIEYFGLKGDADYDEMSEKKRGYWDGKEDWTLIEFSPGDIMGAGVDSFLKELKSSLEEQGISCVRLSEDEIWHRVRDRAIDRFTAATVGFIGRCRKQSLSPAELRSLIEHYSPVSAVEKMFLNLAHGLYVAYLDRLCATGEEDFDGLMQRSAHAIESGQTLFSRKSGSGDLAMLRYVCIDEFQDFSDLFYRLLTSIRKQNPKIELFCVGDDWQAINGFAGSDLKYFENFTHYIGASRRLYISTNYRSSSAIVAVGNALMDELGKPAIAHKQSAGKVLVSDLNEFEPSLLEKQRHPGDIITPAVLRLASKALADGLDVVLLCRRNAIPWFVNYQDQDGVDGRGLARYLDLIHSFFPKGLKERVSISTAHKYKGLEKPMVIVLDAIARSYPLIHPDWAFSRVLGDSPEKITREERRLLYVALTRAVEKLVVITDGRSKSPFLEELERRQPFRAIDWKEYPSVRGKTTRLTVKVGNQNQRGGAPTFAIKDLLKAGGYQWQSTNWPGWAKSFPAEGFGIEIIQNELWAQPADGIEVRVLDDTDTLAAHYLVDAARWLCLTDQLATLCAPVTGPD
jgi:DNA helicase-4